MASGSKALFLKRRYTAMQDALKFDATQSMPVDIFPDPDLPPAERVLAPRRQRARSRVNPPIQHCVRYCLLAAALFAVICS
jgi:hypothetical protein